jgi:hypothetical protein
MERLYNRRSKRLALQVPVRVYGQGDSRNGFREETRTLSINANGSLVSIVAPVEMGQTLLLMNRMTGEEQECRVAYVGPVAQGRMKVGLAFRHPAPRFWQVDFPQVQPQAAERARARSVGSTGR